MIHNKRCKKYRQPAIDLSIENELRRHGGLFGRQRAGGQTFGQVARAGKNPMRGSAQHLLRGCRSDRDHEPWQGNPVTHTYRNRPDSTRMPVATDSAMAARGCLRRCWDRPHPCAGIAPGHDHRAELSSNRRRRPSGSHIAPSRSWSRKPPTRLPATASTMMTK